MFTYNLASGIGDQLTFERGHRPTWSPDGSSLVYSSMRDGTNAEDLWVHAADGSTPPRIALSVEGDQHAEAWPADNLLVYETLGDRFAFDPTAENPTPVPWDPVSAVENEIAISPSGDKAAYVSSELGEPEVFVRDFPRAGGKWRLSTSSGSRPRWSGDGQSVFYVASDGQTIVQTRLRLDPSVVPLGTQTIWRVPGLGDRALDRTTGRAVAVQTIASGAEAATEAGLTVIVNWFEELRRLTAGAAPN